MIHCVTLGGVAARCDKVLCPSRNAMSVRYLGFYFFHIAFVVGADFLRGLPPRPNQVFIERLFIEDALAETTIGSASTRAPLVGREFEKHLFAQAAAADLMPLPWGWILLWSQLS